MISCISNSLRKRRYLALSRAIEEVAKHWYNVSNFLFGKFPQHLRNFEVPFKEQTISLLDFFLL